MLLIAFIADANKAWLPHNVIDSLYATFPPGFLAILLLLLFLLLLLSWFLQYLICLPFKNGYVDKMNVFIYCNSDTLVLTSVLHQDLGLLGVIVLIYFHLFVSSIYFINVM